MSQSIKIPPHSYISCNAELVQICANMPATSLLAIDCEFIRRVTFLPVPALLQLAWLDSNGNKECALIDPLGIDNWQPLVNRLDSANHNNPVVMHAAGEDIQVLRQLGIKTFTLFDTQLACALATGEDALGLSTLLAGELGVNLSSSVRVQRSNWLKRPLSQAQLDYAVLDVIHLPALYAKLRVRLDTLERTQWLWQECDQLFTHTSSWPEESAWSRIKGSNRISKPLELTRLKILAAWRESIAVECNRPRNMILADETLLALCKNPHDLMPELRSSSFGHQARSAQIAALQLKLQQASDKDAPPRKLLTKAQRDELKRLKSMVSACAAKIAVPPRLLANKRRLSAKIRGKEVDFGAWQNPFMQQVLAQHHEQEQILLQEVE